MTSSLRHRTIETSREILAQLYTLGREEFFTCHLVLVPREGDTEPNTLKIDLRRVPGVESSYQSPNNDRVYRTTGRFSGDRREFDVDVTIHHREGSTVGATITMSSRSLEIFTDIIRQKGK